MDTGDPLELDTWTHLVMVHEGDKDLIYVNGLLANEKESLGPLSKTNYPLGIGFDPIGGGNFFDGAIDDLKIYSKGLSAQEVSDLYDLEASEPVIDDELVANYPFSGNSYDATPFNNNATPALLGMDRFEKGNNAALFTGSNEVSASSSKQLNSPQATVSFWANPDSYPAMGEVYLISYGGWQERFKASLPSSGKVVWTTNHTNGISDMDSGEGGELPTGEWTHVVLVHDGAQDLIYFNGVKIAEKDVVGDLNETTKDLGIGYNAVDGGNGFIGSLDEVQLYNKALTDAEILALFTAQSEAPIGGDESAPEAPLDLTSEVVFNNISLLWSPATDDVGVTSYNVYVDSVATLTTAYTNAYFPQLTPLTTYKFGVSALDAAGNESAITTLSVTTLADETPDTIPPSAPPNLMASPSFNSVLLSWDESTDDTQVNGYIVYVDGDYQDSLSASNLSILIGGLEPSELYSFEVAAFDLAGNLSELSELTVSTTEPLETAEPGLVAHYPFNGDANDATPYENHGAIGGDPIFETSDHPLGGMNIVFDGDQDSVLVPNGVHLLSDYTSVSFWIRVDDQNLDDPESYVLDFGHWDERWKISLPQHLKIVWTTNGNNTQFPVFISDMDSGDGNEMVKGFWWHVVMVHDGVSDIIYVNGIQANIKPVDGELNATARPFGMGSNPVDGGSYFIGGLDEVKVYNRALTDDEIAKLFTDGTVGVEDLVLVNKYINDVFPNPASNKLIVQHDLPTKQNVLINIYDVTGRQVARKHMDKSEVASGQFVINVSSFKLGTYFMNINYGGKNLGSIKFVKN
jgi:chitodextrinase